MSRYARQISFAPFGEEGQRRLSASRVLLVGCGALGSNLANTLVRAGAGFLRIVDRDRIELNNLQRQILFDEDDLAAGLPKAEAARRKLARINSEVSVDAVVADATHRNIEEFAEGTDLLLDGTDNFETRYLINDLAVASNRPWIYGACVGATGLSLPILPGQTPCLRCVFEQAPPPEMNATCETAGILGPTASMVAARQAFEAIKILSGYPQAVDRRLFRFDAWENRFTYVDVSAAFSADCPCCGRREFDHLAGKNAGAALSPEPACCGGPALECADGGSAPTATLLCGGDAVQITPAQAPSTETGKLDLVLAAEKLRAAGATDVSQNAFMVKCQVSGTKLTLFPDGRAILGTTDTDRARDLYDRYFGRTGDGRP